MPKKRLASGRIVEVLDGESREDSMKRLVKSGEAKFEEFFPKIDIKAKAREAVQRQAQGLSAVDKFRVGVGETLDRASGRLADMFGLGWDTGYEERTKLSEEVKGAAAFAGRIAPLLATGAIGGASIPGQMAAGAVTGALTGEDAKTGALMGAGGAALGNLAARGGAKALNGIKGKWAERTIKGVNEETEAIRDLARLGFKITPGKAVERGMVKKGLDAIAEGNPILGTAHQSIADFNKRKLTEYAAKSVGVNTDDIGRKALAKMDANIDEAFKLVADSIDGEITLPANALKELDEVSLLSDTSLKNMGIDPSDFRNLGKVTGKQYMKLRSKLLEIFRTSKNQDDLAARSIETLDDVAKGYTPPEFEDVYAIAREKYKNLLVLEKYRNALSSGGSINPSAADRAASSLYGKTYSRLGAVNEETGEVWKPILKESEDFLRALKGMSTDRMTGKDGLSATIGTYSTFMTAAALGGSLAGGGPVGGGLALGGAVMIPRMLMAETATAAGKVAGSATGKTLPKVYDEVMR